MKGAAARLERERRQLAWAVWHVAALPTAKKFPKLAEFLGGEGTKPAARRGQSPEEMMAVARQWHATVTRM